MTIGLFFILLAIFLVISLPVGAVFGLMAILPGMMGTLNYGAIDVARSATRPQVSRVQWL